MKMSKQFALFALAATAAVPAVAQTPTTTTPPATAGKPQGAPLGTPTPSATTPATAAPMGTPTPSATGAATAGTAAPAAAGANPMVGGAEMLPTKNIVENASKSADHTMLVKAVTAAGLAPTLSGPGPFTVFAPTNEAFSRLAPGTVDTLLKPENKATLVKVLTYHVVAGKLTLADIQKQATAGGGKVTLTTVEGEPLVVSVEGQAVKLTDVNGNASYLQQPDVLQSNGVIHVVNGVLLPKIG